MTLTYGHRRLFLKYVVSLVLKYVGRSLMLLRAAVWRASLMIRQAYWVLMSPLRAGVSESAVLARCLKLRHFESVGPTFFKLEDWLFLCKRNFLHLDQVRVEA